MSKTIKKVLYLLLALSIGVGVSTMLAVSLSAIEGINMSNISTLSFIVCSIIGSVVLKTGLDRLEKQAD